MNFETLIPVVFGSLSVLFLVGFLVGGGLLALSAREGRFR